VADEFGGNRAGDNGEENQSWLADNGFVPVESSLTRRSQHTLVIIHEMGGADCGWPHLATSWRASSARSLAAD
jgi:hypothetical protein